MAVRELERERVTTTIKLEFPIATIRELEGARGIIRERELEFYI